MAFRGLFIGIDRYVSPSARELTCAKRDAVALEALFADIFERHTMNDMIEVITKGEAPDMPAFGGRMSAEEILALATHIEANFRPKSATPVR